MKINIFKTKLGFYNLPLSKYRIDKNISEDIVLFGVKYDKGSRFKGSKHSPPFLRALSKKIFIGKTRFLMNRDNTKLRGFFNHKNDAFILPGKTIADYGDIPLHFLEEFIELRTPSTITLAIGGDHSVTYHILKNFKHEISFGVFFIDAHEDIGEKFTYCKSNNVVTWLKTLGKIDYINQVGLRGYSCNRRDKNIFKVVYPSNPNIQIYVPKNRPDCYISIDLDVLDPQIFPAVGTPMVNGITFEGLKSLLKQIFVNYKVIGVDIVEFNPKKDKGRLSGLLVLDLILFIFEMISVYQNNSDEFRILD
ncbi:MAG: arginase family protein [Candidatus Helarchaeota archaeon]